MPLPKEPVHVMDEIYALPDGERAELINGQIFLMAPPSRIHQDIAGRMYGTILQHINTNKGKCLPYIAPFAVFLDEDTNYVEPDVVVICDTNKLDQYGCHGAPDWVIEVVSPSSRNMDYYTKLVLYRDAGVKEYWIVDPMRETVLVYLMEASEAPILYRFSDCIAVSKLPGLEINIKDLVKIEMEENCP